MGWKEIYKSKIISGEEAVKKIKSGDRVVISDCAGEPAYLVKKMIENREAYRNVELVNSVTISEFEYAKPGMEKYFTPNAFFVTGAMRESLNSGRALFTTGYFHEFPAFFKTTMRPDVSLICVSPPDEHGYCSFGVTVDYAKPAAEAAKMIIAQVNAAMPRTLGDTFIHVSDIDYFVEYTEPLPELPLPKIGEVEEKIGKYCASLVNDGDTLQLGIGAIPDSVVACLYDKKDLGVHSEMVSDRVIELVKAGVITNERKTLHKNKIVATFLMGTKAVYDFADNNPLIEMYDVTYVNDPLVIMKNDNMVSINACVEVDFTGQVCSESIGPYQISGVGGQVDFVRGAAMSKGGRSIIAMPSTAKNGTVSKIVPEFKSGTVVTTTRNDVHYIVTEYGIAELKGKTTADRARALIRIAHPDFREKLKEDFEKKFCRRF